MKLQAAFKLSALAAALTLSTASFAATIINDDVEVSGDAIVEGGILVVGDNLIGGELLVDGQSTLNDDTTINGILTVNGIETKDTPNSPTSTDSTLTTQSLGKPNDTVNIEYKDTYKRGATTETTSQIVTNGKLEFNSKTVNNEQERVVDKTANANYDAQGEFSGINNVNTVNDTGFVNKKSTTISEDTIIVGKEKAGSANALTVRNTSNDANGNTVTTQTVVTADGIKTVTINPLDSKETIIATKIDLLESTKINLAGKDLQTTLNAEETARKNADEDLQKNITAEETARKSADTALDGRITTNTSDIAKNTATISGFDSRISDLNTRANQLNQRVDDVEKTAYRGVAIALAAQQNVPNIKPGQFAVFGGVGHYESESAFAMGVVGAINERTSISGALGVAGGSEIGGRVGVAYVFGGK